MSGLRNIGIWFFWLRVGTIAGQKFLAFLGCHNSWATVASAVDAIEFLEACLNFMYQMGNSHINSETMPP